MKGQKQAPVATKQAPVQKAKQVQKAARKNRKITKHRVHYQVRFHRTAPLKLDRKPKYARFARQLFPKSKGLDLHSVLKNPLITEKDMKKMEDENTMVFVVDSRATKPQIRKAFKTLHGVTVRSVNIIYQTLNTFQGFKKAYIRLGGESEALNLANKIGII